MKSTKFKWKRFLVLVPLLMICIKLIHVKYNAIEVDFTSQKYKTELLARRRYLIDELYKGSFTVDKMPKVGAPFQQEFAVSATMLTGITLTNMAFLYPDTREESQRVVEDLVELMLSPGHRSLGIIKWDKDPITQLYEEGVPQVWYLYSLGYLLSCHYYLGGTGYDSLYTKIHTTAIEAIKNSATPYLETYPDETYTADNTLLYAALKRYSQLTGLANDSLFKSWITYTKEHVLDTSTGLIKSYVIDYDDPAINSRGSWTGWIGNFLPLIDSTFAHQQYEQAQEHLFDSFMGFHMVREYPRGIKTSGDWDSGPVILGGSTTGTAFMIGTAIRQQEWNQASKFLVTAEMAGTSLGSHKRHYLLAPIVGDAVMTMCMSHTEWDRRFIKSDPK